MMQRISLSVVVALLSCLLLAAADDDLPDLEKVLENHKALLESIQSGRITYVRTLTLGTDNLEEFKKHYRKDAEKKLRQAKAAGADKNHLRILERQFNNYADEATKQMMRGTEHQRVSYVFDKGANAVRSDTTDLRDVAGLMSRYGVKGEVQTYEQTKTRSIANGTQRILSGQPPRLSIHPWKQSTVPIEPLSLSGYIRGGFPTTADDDYTESVRTRRDKDNPNLIIHEIISKPQSTERAFVMKGGKFESVRIPLDEPFIAKGVIVLDESKGYRAVSMTRFKNDRPVEEYSFEYSSDDPLSMPKMVKITTYRDDGSVERSQTIRMESVELNVEIAASEFEIDVPRGTTIYDYTGAEPLVIRPDELHEIAEEVEDVLEEEVIETAPAEVEELPAEETEAPALVEAVLEPVAEEDEAPAPAQEAREDGGGAIMAIGIAFVVIAAIIAVALWARRRNR